MHDQVYLLYHIRPEGQLLLVGVYREEEDVKAAIGRLKDKPGFVQHPNCFEYHAYDLGADIWGEGFTDDGEDSEEQHESSATKVH